MVAERYGISEQTVWIWRKRGATGNHEFDRLCADLGIEHRLAPPMRPQTNGMVERFNGRIEDVLQSHRFRSGEDLEQTILRYVTSTTARFRSPFSRAEHLRDISLPRYRSTI